MSSTDSLREQVIDGLRQHLDDVAFSKYVRRGGLDHWIFNLIEQYGLDQRIDELALNLRHVGHTECSEYGVGIVYSTKERLAELERKKEEL